MRLVLGQMGRHEAAFTPITFAVWYEYLAGFNVHLSTAMGMLLDKSLKVDDEAVLALHEQHVAPVGEDTFAKFTSEMDRLMKLMSDEAGKTGKQAGAYGMQLSGLSAAIASKDPKQLMPRLAEVMAGTTAMKEVATTLERRVAESQTEIESLRTALDRAIGESLIDPLTGIFNRRGFDQQIDLLLTESARADGEYCLVLFDIDHFKKVNDTHGHLVGDRVIKAMGDILRASVTDTLHAVARYGGEEFALIARRTTTQACMSLAERIRERCKAMKFRDRVTNEVMLTISVSAGLTQVKRGDDAVAAIGRADSALYQSKTAGRDRLTCALA